MRDSDLNNYIKRSHLRAVEKFAEELEAFRKETEEEAAVLYEDAFTFFTLGNLQIEDGTLVYDYDGETMCDRVVFCDADTGEYYEDDGVDGIMNTIKFWRACLRRAKRYWAMDMEKLDAIQSGEIEDDEEEGE